MSNNITPAVTLALQTSISELVTRIMAKAGMSTAEVALAIETYVTDIKADDGQAQAGVGEGLVNATQAMMTAQKAIDDWVGAAPEALDTLVEISQRFQDDADAVTALIETVALKADKTYVDQQIAISGAKSGVDLNAAAYDGLFGKVELLETVPVGNYSGSASVSRLKFAGADVVEGSLEAINPAVVLKVDASVSVGGVAQSFVADDSDAGTGQITFPFAHQGGLVKVIVDSEVVYDPTAAEPGTAPDVSVPGEVTLATQLTTGQNVSFVSYAPMATGENLFHVATVKAYYQNRTFQADVTGEPGTAVVLDWSSAEYMVDELATILTTAFNAQAV